jgi:hypothetical protein
MESSYSDPTLLAYSDARTEYTKQLCQFIVPATFKFFTRLLDRAREEVGRESQKTLFQFQTFLKEIPEWNMEKVTNEIKRLEYEIGCEYLEDLLTAVFIAHTKILTAIRVSSKKNANVQINVPKTERFLFKVLCETSNLYWKNTYLFRDDIKNLDKQQNYRQAEHMIIEGVSMAIRALVPVKNILRECVIMNNDQVEADTDDADDAVADTEVDAEVAAARAIADAVETQKLAPPLNHEEHPVVQALLNGPPAPASASADAEQSTKPASDAAESSATAEASANADADAGAEQILQIDESPSVEFAEYNTVFDGKDTNYVKHGGGEDTEGGLLEISDEPGTAFDEFDSLEETESAPAELSADDFDTL